MPVFLRIQRTIGRNQTRIGPLRRESAAISKGVITLLGYGASRTTERPATEQRLELGFGQLEQSLRKCGLDFASRKTERSFVLLSRKFVCEVPLCFREIELVDQEKLVSTALLEFSNQEWV